VSALLGALSPFILFMSSEFMNHASTLLFFALFVLFFAKTIRTGRIGHALIAGASLGMILLIRPLTAVGLAVPFCIYACYLLVTRFRELRPPMAAMTVMVVIFAGILLGFNALTTGDPLLFGYEVLYGPGIKPGFGHAGWGDPHTPIKGLYQTLNNLIGLNKYLFEWPVPSLLFVFLLFALHTRDKWDYLLLAAFLSLTIAYFFYWFQQLLFGPRFLYESSAALIVLTARGLQRVPVFVREILGLPVSSRRACAATASFVTVCFLFAVLGNIPPLIRYYGHDLGRVNAKVLQAVKQRGISRAIVFTRSNFGSVFTANSPLLNGDIIYARDLGEKNRLLMADFPGYEYYLADGRNIRRLEAR